MEKEPSDYDAGLPPVKENELEREQGSDFLNMGIVLRKFQPVLWAVLGQSHPAGGQHLTDMGLLIIPATLRHWLGVAIGKHNLMQTW